MKRLLIAEIPCEIEPGILVSKPETKAGGERIGRAVSPSLVATTLPRLGLQESFSAAIIHKTELSGYELPLTI